MSAHQPFGRGIRAGVWRLFRLPIRTQAAAHADADAELESLMSERVEFLIARGMVPAEARAEALRRLGGSMEEVRADLRRSVEQRESRRRLRDRVEAVLADWLFAIRQFRRAPGFTLLAVLMVALGIGANTAIFSVVNRLMFSPLPHPNGARIVMPVLQSDGPVFSSAGSATVSAWKARAHAVSMVAGVSETMFAIRPDGSMDSMPAAGITSNLLATLGVVPVLGRDFTLSDEQPGSAVAMIGYELWQLEYGGRRDVIGARVNYGGAPRTIVGVTPRRLTIPMSHNTAPQIWLPITLERSDAGTGGVPGPAEPHSIVSLVVGMGLRLAVVGVFTGVGIAAAASRVLRSLLYEVQTADRQHSPSPRYASRRLR